MKTLLRKALWTLTGAALAATVFVGSGWAAPTTTTTVAEATDETPVDGLRDKSVEPTVGPITRAGHTVNTSFQILSATPTTSQVWYQTVPNPPFRVTSMGVSVGWVGPGDRDPYAGWDWIDIRTGDQGGPRVGGYKQGWDWACPSADYKDSCGPYGSTTVATGVLTKGQKYTVLYYSGGGNIRNGTLEATFEFWA